MPGAKNINISFRLSATDAKRLAPLAERAGLSAGEACRALVLLGLDQAEALRNLERMLRLVLRNQKALAYAVLCNSGARATEEAAEHWIEEHILPRPRKKGM